MRLTHAEIRNGMALLTGEDGRQIQVYVDDNLRVHAGRECSTSADGFYVTYLMPLASDGVLHIPMNMKVRYLGGGGGGGSSGFGNTSATAGSGRGL